MSKVINEPTECAHRQPDPKDWNEIKCNIIGISCVCSNIFPIKCPLQDCLYPRSSKRRTDERS
jgi:hypothetical protein